MGVITTVGGPPAGLFVVALVLSTNAAATGELNNGNNKNKAIKHIALILNLTFDFLFIYFHL
jgi:hypothetical protein